MKENNRTILKQLEQEKERYSTKCKEKRFIEIPCGKNNDKIVKVQKRRFKSIEQLYLPKEKAKEKSQALRHEFRKDLFIDNEGYLYTLKDGTLYANAVNATQGRVFYNIQLFRKDSKYYQNKAVSLRNYQLLALLNGENAIIGGVLRIEGFDLIEVHHLIDRFHNKWDELQALKGHEHKMFTAKEDDKILEYAKKVSDEVDKTKKARIFFTEDLENEKELTYPKGYMRELSEDKTKSLQLSALNEMFDKGFETMMYAKAMEQVENLDELVERLNKQYNLDFNFSEWLIYFSFLNNLDNPPMSLGEQKGVRLNKY